jgi:hypothetical protein
MLALIPAPASTVTGDVDPLTARMMPGGGGGDTGGGGGDTGGGGGGDTPDTVIAALVASTVKVLLEKNLTSHCPAAAGTTRSTMPAVTPVGGTEPRRSLVLSHAHETGLPGPLATPEA